VLSHIDSDISRKYFLEYIRKTDLTKGVVGAAFEALEYAGSNEFAGAIFSALRRKNSKVYYQRGAVGKLYLFDRRSIDYIYCMPRFKSLEIDCGVGLDPYEILRTRKVGEAGLYSLTLRNVEGRLKTEFLREFAHLNELNLLNVSRIDEFNFLSSLDNVNTLRLFSCGVNDFQSLEYSNVRHISLSCVDPALIFESLEVFATSGIDIRVDRETWDEVRGIARDYQVDLSYFDEIAYLGEGEAEMLDDEVGASLR
jgi:hypothetical protein